MLKRWSIVYLRRFVHHDILRNMLHVLYSEYCCCCIIKIFVLMYTVSRILVNLIYVLSFTLFVHFRFLFVARLTVKSIVHSREQYFQCVIWRLRLYQAVNMMCAYHWWAKSMWAWSVARSMLHHVTRKVGQCHLYDLASEKCSRWHAINYQLLVGGINWAHTYFKHRVLIGMSHLCRSSVKASSGACVCLKLQFHYHVAEAEVLQGAEPVERTKPN